MRLIDATRRLDEMAAEGKVVYRTSELSTLFGERRSGSGSLSTTLSSLVRSGVLERVSRGIYLYRFRATAGVDILHEIARALRPRSVCVESLETGAAEREMTTQEYPRTLTVVTTGTGGRYDCSVGSVVMVHTEEPGHQLLASCDRREGGLLPLASRRTVLHHMRRCGRDLHILDNLEGGAA